MISLTLYFIALAAALGIAWTGMDFSPSFTAMFAFAFLCLTALSELCLHFRGRRAALSVGRLSQIVGALFLFPATLIYAMQDDWFPYCIRFALVAGLLAHLAYWLLLRRRGKKLGFGAGAETWLMLTAGILTVSCAIPSPGLWPFALGMLLILTGKRFADFREEQTLPRLATAVGALLCAAFLIAPMLF